MPMPDAAQTTPEPRADWMADHLHALFDLVEVADAGLRLEIRCIHPITRVIIAETFLVTAQGMAAAVEFARSQNVLGTNCYVGVNPRKKTTRTAYCLLIKFMAAASRQTILFILLCRF